MNLNRFLSELRGRGVYRVAAIYAAGTWALLQVADILFPMVGFPDWAITSVLAAAALGFPIALVLAWLFDITPEGIAETDTLGIDRERMRMSPAHLIELTLFLGLVFLVGFLYMDRLSLMGQVEKHAAFAGEEERPSIAVMPFVNVSDVSEAGYFGEGLAEEILNLLARLNELNVAARNSSFHFQDREADIQEIARQLGVRHVLEGSVRLHGNKIRVTAQLIDASNGFHIWSETYDRDFNDTFLIQDEIARQVVDVLQVLLSESSLEILSTRPALVPEAYDYYLQGRDYLRSSKSEESLSSAIELFGKAIDLDDSYAEAYAGICDANLVRYTASSDPQDFQNAKLGCDTAISLNDEGLPVYVALGNLYRLSGKYGLALAQFRKALDLNPSSVDALNGLAQTYDLDNKPNLAEETFLQVIALQPAYWGSYNSMGSFLFAAGRFEEAIPYYKRITELMPDNAEAFNNLGAAYYLLGQFGPAAEALQQSLTLAPTALAYSNAGSSLFFLGRFEDAVGMYQKAVEYAPENFQSWGDLADAYRYTDELQELAEPMYRNAVKLASERLKVNPTDANTLALVGYYQARIGLREEALIDISQATALAPKNMYVYYTVATAMCALGETELAVAAIYKAIDLGYLLELAKIDPTLCGLGDSPYVGS